MGGASPTSPKSMEPTFSASSCTGPAVNSVHFTVTPSGARRFSSVPRPLRTLSGPFWLPMRSWRAGAWASAANDGSTTAAATPWIRRRRGAEINVMAMLGYGCAARSGSGNETHDQRNGADDDDAHGKIAQRV